VGSTGAGSWNPRDTLLRAKDRSPPGLVRFVMRLVREMQRLEPFDRAMTLAAQAFTSIVPLVIVALAVLPRPDANRLGDRVADALALPSNTRSALLGALPEDTEQAATFGVVSLLIVLLSATSFSRALTRMYAKAWSVRGPGWHSPWRWIAAVVAIASGTVALEALQLAAEGSTARLAGAMLVTFVVNSVLWIWVPSVLLARAVRWQMLAPGGVLMGAASIALYFASRLYMPPALSYAARTFGELGVAFTAIGWLFAVAFVLIVATVLGAVMARGPGPMARWLARRASSATPPVPSRPDTGTTQAQ